MASSLLRTLDLPELIVPTSEDYESAAIALARHPGELARIKAKLIRNRDAGPLFDMPRYSRHLEAAYREMHARWRNGLGPDHIRVPCAPASRA